WCHMGRRSGQADRDRDARVALAWLPRGETRRRHGGGGGEARRGVGPRGAGGGRGGVGERAGGPAAAGGGGGVGAPRPRVEGAEVTGRKRRGRRCSLRGWGGRRRARARRRRSSAAAEAMMRGEGS